LRKVTIEVKAKAEKLQKIQDRELKWRQRCTRKQQAEAAKVACQNAAEKKRKANKARVAELATQQALKKQERNAATAQKACNSTNTSK
jgi:hypothetical protein